VPEKIPHIAPANQNVASVSSQGPSTHANGGAGSPVKENSFLHRETGLNRETSVDDVDEEAKA
jgi:hypothetical protein